VTTAAYFECFAGASGDMILGALVDAGWPEAELRAALESMRVPGWQLEVRPVKKQALRATQVRLSVTEPQPERDVGDIEPLISASDLPAVVKERAISLFRELADVEGIQHDQPPETVHFHEVGAVDSILDIVGACAGLHALGVERLFVSPLNVGGGIVPTRDGILPVPGPAALELLRRKRAPIYASEYGPEFLTPTGALVLATLADGFGPFPRMRVERIGYGAGQKDFTIPNVLRVSIGELDARAAAGHGHGVAQGHDHEHDQVVELQTNIDDMNPEHYGHVSERLASAGALDVTLVPVYMKKGRPGTVISVLAHEDRAELLIDTLFRETTTLGVRFSRLERRMLPRETRTVDTAYGPIRVKLALFDGTIRSAAPEYEDCHAAAVEHDVPIAAVYDAARGVGGRATAASVGPGRIS
jgi:pyridinium-3,5-bisthiocarboxylic acid mononucleotide nickel chelatase